MAIATVSRGDKIRRSSLATIQSSVLSSAKAWNVTTPSAIDTYQPRYTEYDTVTASATAVFNAAVTAGVSTTYTSIWANIHTRGSVLDASDINVLGGNATGSNKKLQSGLATYITTLSPSCGQGCSNAPCSEGCTNPTPCGEGCSEGCSEPCSDCACSETCGETCGESCSESCSECANCSESCSECSDCS